MEERRSKTLTPYLPLCEVHELDPYGRDSILCPHRGHFGGVFLESLRQGSALPDAIGAHACECGHPEEIRRLPPRGCSTARRAGRRFYPRPSGGTELGLQTSTVLHRELSKRHTEGEGDGKRLRGAQLWSTVLVIIGVLGVVFVVIGTIFAMIEAVTFGQAIAILLIGGPLAALFASWPIALGQGLRALADVAEYVREPQSRVR
jgi:hypothetical protein